ncbi:hypothetical protein BH20ACT18_BH20ACT18_12190 [soil metagenome]
MGPIRAFPVQKPIRPEHRQVGRRPAIDALCRQVVEKRQDTLLLAPRRVGKTSMAWAVLDRIRDNDAGWALEVDLSRGPITTSATLADRLAEQARAARVHVEGADSRAWLRRGRGVLKLSPALKAAGAAVGIDEAVDAATIGAAIDQALAPVDDDVGSPELREVLLAIHAATLAADRQATIFVDEIQRLITHWTDPTDSDYAQGVLAEIMELADGNVVVLVAGSDGQAVGELMAVGRPLHHDGMTFAVPEIRADDWHAELPPRFAEIGLTVTRQNIEQILDASGGHPQRTMRVCAHVEQLADGDVFEVSDVLIEQAIETTKGHPSWSD